MILFIYFKFIRQPKDISIFFNFLEKKLNLIRSWEKDFYIDCVLKEENEMIVFHFLSRNSGDYFPFINVLLDYTHHFVFIFFWLFICFQYLVFFYFFYNLLLNF